jgi:YgiT-type zinc finger domain-containing protein
MKCISCGAEAAYGTTSDVTDLKDCLIIVRNTPCYKCAECNEIIYRGDVVKRLDEITEAVKKSMNELAVFDYNSVVA